VGNTEFSLISNADRSQELGRQKLEGTIVSAVIVENKYLLIATDKQLVKYSLTRNYEKGTIRFTEPLLIAKGQFKFLKVSNCGRMFVTHSITKNGPLSSVYIAKTNQKVL